MIASRLFTPQEDLTMSESYPLRSKAQESNVHSRVAGGAPQLGPRLNLPNTLRGQRCHR
jgi:hypothetical protein